MVLFGTITAADEIEIDNTSIYLCELGEWPILGILLNEMDKSVVREWSVVLGHDHDIHRRAVENIPMTYVVDDYWRNGFDSHAIRGLKEMPPQADGFIILPGNSPFFTTEIMNTMSDALTAEKGFIIVAKHENKVLPYPLFHRRYLGEVLDRLEKGKFSSVLKDHPAETFEMEISSDHFLIRVDDERSLKRARDIFYKIDEGDALSNPQSNIPQ